MRAQRKALVLKHRADKLKVLRERRKREHELLGLRKTLERERAERDAAASELTSVRGEVDALRAAVAAGGAAAAESQAAVDALLEKQRGLEAQRAEGPSKRFAEHFHAFRVGGGHKTRTGTLSSADQISAPVY